ncbi:MAG: DUF2249 domain-containing protein [Proteobacteria bacterium]|nr:DUF2249 domain-containing protein [Pseudomonadota bacterium]
MTLTTYGTKVDVRPLAPHERHPLIFNTFRALGGGEAMELYSDHDPRQLHRRFDEVLPKSFAWDDLESGPQTWRVRITKLAGNPLHRHGCGACAPA